MKIADYFNLIGGTLIAGDSTKFRAQNSKKNNFNQKKIDRHLAYIENKLQEYYEALANSDGESQVSTSDPDSRQLITRNNITEVGYNLQTTVDAKHNLPIDYKVTNSNDVKAMGNMLQRAKSILGTNVFTALYDKGYHTGSELKTAHDLKITTLVAIPGQTVQAPDPAYNVENFTYVPEGDYYLCPQNQQLTTAGNWYKGKFYNFKRYTTKACKTCHAKPLCSTATKGKGVHRSEFHEYIQNNKVRVEQNKALYKRRQAIVEHPYDTIKRQWGFSYIMTKKGSQRAGADLGLMMKAYNLKRIINILGVERLGKFLQDRTGLFFSKMAVLGRIQAQMQRLFREPGFWNAYLLHPVNRLVLIKTSTANGGF